MTEGLQLKDINEADIDDNDILLGRGGKTNHHPGNAAYLKQIEARQVEYMFLESRTEKTEYAMNFVQKLRKEGIRFLKKDDKEGKKWSDVGDVKMREKVSQNLREHQPKLKKQLAEQQRQEQLAQQGMAMPQLNPQTSGQQQQQMGMPPLVQQTSGQQMMGNMNLSPMGQRQFVDHQQLMQQQQFLQMQAMAQQNQLQTQQQFQLLQQQQRMGSNSQFPNYPNQMIRNGMNNMGMQVPVLSMGTGGMGNNNNNMNPLPFNEITAQPGMAQWSTSDERECGLLDGFNTQDHRMSSLTALPETIESSLAQEQEEFAREERAFSKQQMFANRDHQHSQSNESLPEPDDLDNDDMPLQNIAKPSLGNRVATLTDVDVQIAMGESTHSLLDSLHIEQVPEGQEGEEDPLSPKPNMATINGTEQITPILNNKQKIVPPFGGFGPKDPATVTPNPNSPKQKSGNAWVLDNDVLSAWANTTASDDDEGSFADALASEDGPGLPTAGSFGGAGRSQSARPDPFRTTSPTPPPRAVSDGPSRPGALKMGNRTISKGSRPVHVTKDKRQTSNINETPETRGNLKFQEGPLNDELGGSFSSQDHQAGSFSMSSFSSVKKASLGRDKSAQSRLLKQQCMPYAYGPATGSFSTVSSTSTASTMGSAHNGWPTTLPLNDASTLSPTPTPGGKGGSNITPKTDRVLQDFGKMALSQQNGMSPKPRNVARTAQSFDDICKQDPAAADQIAMDLMVKKPAPLQWRNRTSTIEALDLDSLEDDAVLKEEREESPTKRTSRTSINSIAGMWANMPTSEDFEALVSGIAGEQAGDLAEPSIGKQNKAPASLALPGLGA